MRAYLLFIGVAASPAFAESACKSVDWCQYFIQVEGEFKATPDFPDANAKVLNENFEKAIAHATKTLRLKATRDEKQKTLWKQRAPKETDVFFVLVFRAGPGNELEIRASSLSRGENLWGISRTQIAPVPKPQWQVTALKSKVMRGVSAAMDDLSLRIEESVKTTMPELRVSILVNRLPSKARDYVEKILLGCIRGLYDTPVGKEPVSNYSSGYVEYAFAYLKMAGEPRMPLSKHAEKVRQALGAGNKECSLDRTPLESFLPEVSEDELNQALRIQFRDKK